MITSFRFYGRCVLSKKLRFLNNADPNGIDIVRTHRQDRKN
jgi:hypothetical protein